MKWLKMRFVGSDFQGFQYGVPDAGMQDNEIRQLDNDVVRVTFIFSL